MLEASQEVDIADRDFSQGALLDLVAGLRPLPLGELLALVGRAPRLRAELASWSRLTGHGLVEVEELPNGSIRYVLRKGGPGPVAGADPGAEEGPGERLWIYTNFHCNLACSYCCVRSSPRAEPRALSVEQVGRICSEARELFFHRILLTGGEPFLHPEIGAMLGSCTAALPTTVLTNGTLLRGPRGRVLDTLSRERLTLQVSLDSPRPPLHDAHRGPGSWARAWEGIEHARGMGFRVRVASTLTEERDRKEMDRWLEEQGFPPGDRVVRPLARRGQAKVGVPLSRADLVPEVTISAQGVYWHPVGADDDDFLVCRPLTPLARSIERLQSLWNEERATSTSLAEVFHCA